VAADRLGWMGFGDAPNRCRAVNGSAGGDEYEALSSARGANFGSVQQMARLGVDLCAEATHGRTRPRCAACEYDGVAALHRRRQRANQFRPTNMETRKRNVGGPAARKPDDVESRGAEARRDMRPDEAGDAYDEDGLGHRGVNPAALHSLGVSFPSTPARRPAVGGSLATRPFRRPPSVPDPPVYGE